MGWFDEQLENRIKHDSAGLEAAVDNIANAVMGQRLTAALSRNEQVRTAAESILKYYGIKPKESEEKQELKTLEEQLEYRLRPHGIMYRTVELDKGWYKRAVGPILCTRTEDGCPVVMLPRGLAGYGYTDPDTGKRKKLNPRTEKLFDEEAICFYLPLPQKSLSVIDILLFASRQRSKADSAAFFAAMGGATLLGLLSPLFTSWLFTDVLESGRLQALLALFGFMAAYAVSRAFYSAFQQLVSARIAAKQDAAVQAAVMNRILSLPTSFFRSCSSGELQQRAEYVRGLCSLLMSSVGTACLTSVFSLVYLVQVFAYAPALVVPSLCITAATLALTIIATLVQRKVTHERMEVSAKNSGLTHSIIAGIQKIKLAGAEKRFFARWADNYAKEASLTYNLPAFLKLSGAINLAVGLAGTMVIYALAVSSDVSTADYYAFNTAYGLVSGAFLSLAGIAGTLSNIGPILNMARPIMQAVPEAAEELEAVTSIKGNIELSNVSFRYDESMPYVINNLSLKIKAGEYTAIVGGTGCGKSTLLRLLLGFEKPEKGAIYYDRRDISSLDMRSLRRCIGVVMQDGRLFRGDIFSNITVSLPKPTMEAAWEAAEMAAVAEDIRAMPMGMHTMISEGQGGISGGQRQRLLIARAVAAKPRVLMFDEATSALDNITQKKVSEAIDALKCTRIVIAHRLSTIRNCDRIIVLDKGRIIEDGSYEELIEKGGFFAELVERQRLDK